MYYADYDVATCPIDDTSTDAPAESLCFGASLDLTTLETAGIVAGIWTVEDATGGSVALVGTNFDSDGLPAGDYTAIYTPIDPVPGSCPINSTETITVNPEIEIIFETELLEYGACVTGNIETEIENGEGALSITWLPEDGITDVTSEDTEVDLNKIVEGVVGNFESQGAKNISVKDEEYETLAGAKGIKVFGNLEVTNSITNKEQKSDYLMLNFAENGGFQQIMVVYDKEDRYAKDIAQRIINSVELKNAK